MLLTFEDKTVDVVLDLFNRVNSGGTRLSTGDLTLARICAQWPQARAHAWKSGHPAASTHLPPEVALRRQLPKAGVGRGICRGADRQASFLGDFTNHGPKIR